MTQQTIGNTVYTVGQILDYYQMLELPSGAEVKISREMVGKDLRLFTILALPNPDPVAEVPTPLTREELLGYNPNQKVWFRDADCLVTYAVCTSSKGGLYALGVPMFRTEAECRLYHEAVAGGRVFVKGGV